MKKWVLFIAIACAGIPVRAAAVSGDNYGINASFLAGAVFPTNLAEAGAAWRYDDVTFDVGLDLSYELFTNVHIGLDFAYSHIWVSSNIAGVGGGGNLYAIAFHGKYKHPITDRIRLVGGMGMGPYISALDVYVGNASASDTDVCFGMNFGLGAEFYVSNTVYIGPMYRTHLVFDPDDTFAAHTINAVVGIGF